MSNGITLKVNEDAVVRMFADFHPKKQKRVILKALKAGGNVIASQAKRNLKKSVKAMPAESVKSIRTVEARDGNGVKVHIMGNRIKTSKSFTLKFFEMGTNRRTTLKKHNRGVINARNFFSSAVTSKQSAAQRKTREVLEKDIQKINAKHK